MERPGNWMMGMWKEEKKKLQLCKGPQFAIKFTENWCVTYQAPGIEMHGCQLSVVWFGDMNIEGLTLINKCPSVSSHLDDSFLWDFPYSLVEILKIVWNSINALYTNTLPDTRLKNIYMNQWSCDTGLSNFRQLRGLTAPHLPMGHIINKNAFFPIN
jgi:hypothetical protein